MENAVKTRLQSLHFGEAQTFKNITIVPLIAPADGTFQYRTLGEALAAGDLVVSEVSDAGSIPDLRPQLLATRLPAAHTPPSKRITPMNPQALAIMREALERISAIHKPTSTPAEKYDPEELLEKLDFAVSTARHALDRAVMPGEALN